MFATFFFFFEKGHPCLQLPTDFWRILINMKPPRTCTWRKLWESSEDPTRVSACSHLLPENELPHAQDMTTYSRYTSFVTILLESHSTRLSLRPPKDTTLGKNSPRRNHRKCFQHNNKNSYSARNPAQDGNDFKKKDENDLRFNTYV